ncbi:MAG: ribonuclease P protein component [Gammaproteobacteria bacterium]|nr:ribonuclease P protein component [Gammaproteobacteria bacterium]
MLTPNLDFARHKRLLTKADYSAVFANPISLKSSYFTMLARPHSAGARLGVIVAKRIMKHAVDRNRVRRLIRESFRHHQQALSGLDIVVLVRCNCADKPSGVLLSCLRKQWQDLIARCASASSQG